MTKAELIAEIANSTDLSRADIERVLDKQAEVVQDVVEKLDHVTLPGIVKIEGKHQPAKTIQSFGVSRALPAKTVPKAKFLTAFKNSVA